jgi:predicted O-methyltransferase YrrM
LSNVLYDYIDDYLNSLIIREENKIEDLRKESLKENVPIIHNDVRQYIELMIEMNKIKNILEVGTAVGYSAAVFCHAMGTDGKVTTIERNPVMIEKAKNNISNLNLENQITLLEGDANEIIPELKKSYDMVFLDGAKGHYIHLLDDCIRLLKPGGLIISDNVLYQGMIASDDLVVRRRITIVKRMRKYLETVSDHPQLTTSVLPIGDGLSVSLKRK